MGAKVKIGFEGVAATGTDTFISNGYAGFNWDNFGAIDQDDLPTSGYDPHSGRAAGFNEYANDATISSADTFAFKQGDFSAAWNDGLTITVDGYRNGVLVAEESFVVNFGENLLHVFGRDFRRVDTVTFSSSGGVDHDANDYGTGTHISMDDLLFKVHSTTALELA